MVNGFGKFFSAKIEFFGDMFERFELFMRLFPGEKKIKRKLTIEN